jgi:hypothetical protein
MTTTHLNNGDALEVCLAAGLIQLIGALIDQGYIAGWYVLYLSHIPNQNA